MSITSRPSQWTATPYPGLRPFRRDESDIFFGRDEQVDELLGRLARRRFLGVVGASGCGKSSLVKAGLLSALDAGLMAGVGSSWHVADMRPGSEPIVNLAAALLESGVLDDRSADDAEDVALVAAILRRGPLGIVELLGEADLPRYTNLLILADQFEEIFRFRQHGNANEALAFVNLLLATAQQQELPVYVVLTMRSDFLGNCTVFPGLPEALNDGQFLCPRLGRDQLREAIEGPCSVFQSEVQPALANRVLNDLGADRDQLPLMQHAMMRVWERAHERGANQTDQPTRLSIDDYAAVGGVAQALSRHADEAYRDVVELEQERLVELLFRCLSDRGPDGQCIRRPTPVADVARVAEVTDDRVIQVVEHFRRADRCFLMPPSQTRLDGKSVIDVSHESLIRRWDRVQGWLDAEADSSRRYRRLLESARLHAAGRGALLRRRELEDVREWWDREQPSAAWTEQYVGQRDACLEFLNNSKRDARRSHIEKVVTSLAILSVVMVSILYFISLRNSRELARQNELVVAAGELANAERLRAEKALVTANEQTLLAEDALAAFKVQKKLAEDRAMEAQHCSGGRKCRAERERRGGDRQKCGRDYDRNWGHVRLPAALRI